MPPTSVENINLCSKTNKINLRSGGSSPQHLRGGAGPDLNMWLVAWRGW